MAFCGNCGTQVEDGVGFCPQCGATMEPPQDTYSYQQAEPYQAPAAAPPVSDEATDAQQNKVMAILAYIFFFVPLLAGEHKKSEFVKFHTNQGTVLALAWLALQIATSVLRTILKAVLYHSAWSLYLLLSRLLSRLLLAILVLCILGIINANNGEKKPLPIIGGFTVIK